MEQEEINTLEARRQLIWAARIEGYWMAIEDLRELGRDNSAQMLQIRMTEERFAPVAE
jgi:hypothetical protein